MAKFVVYEKVAEAAWRNFDKKTSSDAFQTTVNLGSGLVAGFAAAIISQPADTMLSKINKTKGLPGEGTATRLIKIAKELGVRGSFTGINTRLFMVGTLTAFQFAIYGDGMHSSMSFVLNITNSPSQSRRLLALLEVSRSPNKRNRWLRRDCEVETKQIEDFIICMHHRILGWLDSLLLIYNEKWPRAFDAASQKEHWILGNCILVVIDRVANRLIERQS